MTNMSPARADPTLAMTGRGSNKNTRLSITRIQVYPNPQGDRDRIYEKCRGTMGPYVLSSLLI